MVSRLIRKTVATVAAFGILFTDLAWAGSPVADPAAPIGFRPNVQTAPNGVPTVNIAPPSAGGVSHNKYDGFSVPSQGVVLNNSTASGTSVLAGALAANPYLTVPAQVILNEVTGSGGSSLNGPTEVFGTAANIIIANPNGISVDGASFINAPRVTLTTGTPSADGASFALNFGQIQVGGTGLNGTGVTQLDLAGRRVSVDGAISGAGTLNVIGGAADYTYASGQTTASAGAPAQGGAWAVDATALGAMNAGQVHLIGTEAGLGVRALGGVAASAGNVSLTSSGQIVLGGATASQNVTVNAGTDATLSGTTTAASLNATANGTLAHSGNTTLTGAATLSGGTLSNSGTLSADGDVTAAASGDSTLGGAVITRGKLTSTSGGATSISGNVAADGSASVGGASVSVTSSGALTAGGSVGLTASGAVTNAGAVDSGDRLSVDAQSLRNSGRAGGATAVAITTSGDTDNSGGQLTGGQIGIQATGAFTNTSGTVTGSGTVGVTAASIGNRQGFLRSTGAGVTATATGALDNTKGVIGGSDIALSSGSLDNSGGEAIATGNLGVTTTSGALVNKGGTLFAEGTGTLSSAAGIDNTAQGSIGAKGALGITAQGKIDNTGGTLVGNSTVGITTPGQVVQGGNMTAAGTLTASAGSFTNRGYTATADGLSVTTGSLVNESGQIIANSGVTVAATGAVDNRAKIASGTDVGITAATLSSSATGRIEANNNLAVTTTGAMSNAGVMAANGTVTANAGTSLTNTQGSMLSGGDMALTAGTALTNEGGLIQSGGNMALTGGTRIDNRRTPITTVGTANGGYRQQETSDSATMTAVGTLSLVAPVVANQASLLSSGGDMTVTAGTFSNQVNSLTTLTRNGYTVCKGKWYGGKKCHTDYSNSYSYTQTPSLVYAGGTFGIGAASLTNTGTIQAHKVNAVAGVMTNGIVDWTIKTMPAATPAARIDLTQYASLPAGTSGLFDIRRDGASRYVITTTVDMGALIDPDALNARLGQAAAPSPRFFADPFAETELLRRAALAQTGQRFFIPDSKTDEAQRRALYDNAAAFAASRSDVHLGVAFTDAQIAALSKPILWYVDDGTGILAPVVYLPKVSQQNLVHQEGGRIIADEASLQVAGAFTNTGFVTIAGALAIDAGSIVNEQRTARDTALRTFKSKGRTYGQDVVLNVLQAGGEITAGSIRLTATGDISTSGGRLASAGALDMVAGGDVTLAAARVENHESVSGGKVRWTLDTVVNHAAAIAAGLDLSVVAGGDITVAGSKLNAGGDVSLRAGGDAIIAAVVDEYYYDYHSKKSRSKLELTAEKTTNKAAELVSSGGDVSVVAHDNVAVQASRVAAADDITLKAETGGVALLSGTDSSFVHEKSSRESMVWQSTRDRGDSSTSVKMTELEAGGDLNIAAAKGVTADYRATGGLKSSLAELAKNPATAWTTQVALRDDVTWRAVQEAHQSWDYKTQGLSGPAAAVIAIAVAVATQGAGAAALGGFGGTIGAAMGDAAFSALVSQAAVSVINNRGDIGKVLKELGTAQTAKNLAIAMVSAGLTQGIADAAGVSGGAKPTADFADRLAYQGIKTASGVAANTAIGGADLGDALKSGGLSLATTMATQVLAKGVGDMAVDLKIDDGDLRKIIAHALAGCAAGQITKNCVAGAIGAGIQEAAGGVIGTLSDDIDRRVMLAGLSAAVATMVVGGDASAVNAANGIAQDAATYNRQLHVKEVQKLRELAPEYAKQQGISEGEALQRLLAQALRNVDQAYYETHSQWDKSADEFLGRNASGTITVEGKEVLMFAAGGKDYYANPTLLADTWNAFNREAALAYQQTPIKLKSERFETQQKVLEAYLTVVGMLPMGGSIIATLTRYDEAVRNGDTQTQRDIETMLPLELIPYAKDLGKLAQGVKAAGKVEKVAEKADGANNYTDILSPEARQHILYGDKPNSGGHMWPGQPGKTVFPENWPADKIIHEIGDIATSPSTQWYAQTGSGGVFTAGGKPANWVAYEVRDGVRMRVVYQPATGKVVTAFPDSGPIPNYKKIPQQEDQEKK